MSSHFGAHFMTAQNMEVQMVDSLTGITATVGDHAITVFQALCLGDLRNDLKNMGYHSTVFGSDIIDTAQVGLGDH